MRSILLFLLLAPTYLFSQISIGSSSMPSNGDTLRYTVAILDTAVLLNYQNAGPDQTWNFNQLVPQRQGVSEYKSSSQTSYNGIPNRIGEKIADTLAIGGFELYDVYDFYTNSTTEFALDYRGAGFPTGIFFFPVYKIEAAFSDKDEVYQFPLNYGNIDTSTFQFTFSSPNIPGAPRAYYQSGGTRINNIDAWGTITTPYGTFQTIRVVTDIIRFDSISFDGNNVGIPTHTRQYKWLSNQEKSPVLTVQGAVVANVFVPGLVQYRDSIRDVPALLAPVAAFNSDSTVYEINKVVEFNNLSVSLIGGQYKWIISPNTFQYTNNTSANTDSLFVQFTDTGLYDVQLIAINSEGRDTLTRENYIQIVEPNSIKELNKFSFTISPNPIKSGDRIQIEINEQFQLFDVLIKDLKGSIIKNIQLNNGDRSFELPKVNSGIYFIQLNTSKGSAIQKIIVN